MKSTKFQLSAIPTYATALIFYSLIMFIVQLADGIMSYVSPVFIENAVENSFLMGVILASSSVFGIVCDIIFPNIFRAKHHLFFLWNTVLIALLFPIALLFFPHIWPTFLFAMAVWGIYFEFLTFSNAYFIEAFIHVNRHGLAWGVVTTFRSISLFIAPIIAPTLIDNDSSHPLWLAVILLVCGLGSILLFKKFFPEKKHIVVTEVVTKRYSTQKEFAIWRTLLKKMWPIYIFILAIFILEASMMSIGVLATEDLRQQSFWGGMLLAAYTLPNLFTGLLIQKLGSSIGKKKLAFFSGLIGGLLLSLAMLMTNVFLLIGLTFVAACFLSITYPAIMAVVQDYTTRLGTYGGEMVGISNSSGSLGYIIGPLVAGAVSIGVGNVQTIGIMGFVFATISLLNILIVPRKIAMPQKALSQLKLSE